MLGDAAAAAAKTDTFLGERYRRIVKRRGKLKALVAVARSILVIIWHLLADPTARFHDLGADYHTNRIDTERRTRNHIAPTHRHGLPGHPRTRRLNPNPHRHNITRLRTPRRVLSPAHSPRVFFRSDPRMSSLVRRVLRRDLLRTVSPIGKWKWSSPLLTSGCSDDEILPCVVRIADMSDTIDDAAWPPQLKIGREVGNVAGSARRQKSASGVAAAPLRTQVKAGDIHV